MGMAEPARKELVQVGPNARRTMRSKSLVRGSNVVSIMKFASR
jgi:hypothetical protein